MPQSLPSPRISPKLAHRPPSPALSAPHISLPQRPPSSHKRQDYSQRARPYNQSPRDHMLKGGTPRSMAYKGYEWSETAMPDIVDAADRAIRVRLAFHKIQSVYLATCRGYGGKQVMAAWRFEVERENLYAHWEGVISVKALRRLCMRVLDEWFSIVGKRVQWEHMCLRAEARCKQLAILAWRSVGARIRSYSRMCVRSLNGCKTLALSVWKDECTRRKNRSNVVFSMQLRHHTRLLRMYILELSFVVRQKCVILSLAETMQKRSSKRNTLQSCIGAWHAQSRSGPAFRNAAAHMVGSRYTRALCRRGLNAWLDAARVWTRVEAAEQRSKSRRARAVLCGWSQCAAAHICMYRKAVALESRHVRGMHMQVLERMRTHVLHMREYEVVLDRAERKSLCACVRLLRRAFGNWSEVCGEGVRMFEARNRLYVKICRGWVRWVWGVWARVVGATWRRLLLVERNMQKIYRRVAMSVVLAWRAACRMQARRYERLQMLIAKQDLRCVLEGLHTWSLVHVESKRLSRAIAARYHAYIRRFGHTFLKAWRSLVVHTQRLSEHIKRWDIIEKHGWFELWRSLERKNVKLYVLLQKHIREAPRRALARSLLAWHRFVRVHRALLKRFELLAMHERRTRRLLRSGWQGFVAGADHKRDAQVQAHVMQRTLLLRVRNATMFLRDNARAATQRRRALERVRARWIIYTLKWALWSWRSWVNMKWRTEEALFQVMDEM